jgi:hypothetical protein
MKKKLLNWIIFLLVILVDACKKDTGPYPMTLNERMKNSSGTVIATLNGKPWVSTLTNAAYWKDGKFGIVAEYYSNLDEDIFESLGISYIDYLKNFSKVRYQNAVTYEYENGDGPNALFSINDDDASLATYHIISDSIVNSYVEILNYDAATHEIQGKFQLSFYRTYTVESGVYDTVRLTNGAFNLKIN